MRHLLSLAFSAFVAFSASAEVFYNDHDLPPHNYRDAELHDPVSNLASAIASGEVTLAWESPPELLSALLSLLEIPPSSQTLLVSKTSLQRRNIGPNNPRALYFNEETYISYVPGGFLEIISIDPTLGGIFYVIDPAARTSTGKIHFERRFDCLGCHGGSFTEFLPGLMQGSVYIDETGRPVADAPPHWPGHGIPLADRWGGWLLTGADHLPPHLGNLYSPEGRANPTANLTPLRVLDEIPRLDETFGLPVNTSDALALLLHDHQVGFANKVMEIHYRTRLALHRLTAGDLLPRDKEILENEADELIAYLTFATEPDLGSHAPGASEEFRSAFLSKAKRSPEGHSLRDLADGHHLFQNRLSYMIYTQTFQQLPSEFLTIFTPKLLHGLTAEKPPEALAHLGDEERARIRSIVESTDALPQEN